MSFWHYTDLNIGYPLHLAPHCQQLVIGNNDADDDGDDDASGELD